MNAQIAKIDTKQATTPAQLLSMAVQQGADMDRLEKLMALQERWEANEARKAYTVAMTAFKAESVKIMKDKDVKFGTTHYSHARLATISYEVSPFLSKHDLSHHWNVTQADHSVTVECVMTHVAGHSESVSMTAPPDDSGSKNKIQQIGSTVTYLQRYTLLALTGLAAADQDDDGNGSSDEPIDPSWFDAVEGSANETELRKVKADMVKEWKGITNVPKPLVKAYNERFNELKESE